VTRPRLTPLHAKRVALRARRLLQAHRDHIADPDDIAMLEELRSDPYARLKMYRSHEDKLVELETKFGSPTQGSDTEDEEWVDDNEEEDTDETWAERYKDLHLRWNKLNSDRDWLERKLTLWAEALEQAGLVMKLEEKPYRDQPAALLIQDRDKFVAWTHEQTKP
jgi:hypothetical protein